MIEDVPSDQTEATMSETLDSLKLQLGTLPSRDRAEIALFLIDSLDPQSDANAEDAWEAELARRVADIRAGTVKGKPADEVFAELRSRFP
jgi:putative addiction module component (TIGR02574 family)